MAEVIASVAPALESRIGAYRRKHRLPGIAAGLATRDGLRWWHASGFADLETGRRPDQRTLFRIASVTKTITATAVMQLARPRVTSASTTRPCSSSRSSATTEFVDVRLRR